MRNRWGAVALCCLLLVACGSAPEKKPPLTAQAVNRSMRGEAAYQRGDYASALREYSLALRVHLALEQADGIAIARINLARVWQDAGRPEPAHAQLAALFAPPQLPYPGGRLAAAAAMQSALYLTEGRADLAAQWLARGEQLCTAGCEITSSLLLLRAQLALRTQHPDDALQFVAAASKGLQASGQRVELANAHRLSGDIYLSGQDAEHAIAQFEAALQLDRELGLPAKISLDLSRLAQAAQQAGKAEAARDYAARAASVERALHAPDVQP